MKKPTSDFYLTAAKIWGTTVTQDSPKTTAPDFNLELHKKLLNIFNAGRFYYMIFNIYEAELEFISSEIKNVLGYESDEMNSMLFYGENSS